MEGIFRVKALGEVASGASKRDGRTWTRREVWLEEVNKSYPDEVWASLTGDAVGRFGFVVGDKVRATVALGVDEYEGRRYQRARVVRFESADDLRPF